MSNKLQYDCKKCSGVIEVERQLFSGSLSFKIKNGEFKDKMGEVIIVCKNKDEKRKTTCNAETKELDFLMSK